MRIDGVRPTQASNTPKRTDRTGAAGFSLPETAQTRPGGTVAAASATVGLEGLMALQAEEAPVERRRRAVKKGDDILNALDKLKLAMIEGQGGAGAAALLSGVAAKVELTGEPGLDGVLNDISVRAAVELAKLRVRA